ncbi:helix-turn-helix domain-containing protein [Rhizobium sp. 2MFCol3.1]|uniref:helix-turn-helix domain-containing protein n=1 Tax=Rhizobium sp. 2MFCol3.1 TaxID=1246459 RepID=UPI000371E28B|nr:helix-turn-helix domain-containing protein [Rhizobium sp. 2MFCol3.1]
MARTISQSAIRNPVDLIFGVDSNVRVLRVLARHGGLLSAADISQRAALSKSSTRLGLLSLEEIGVIFAEGTGYNRLYRLYPEYCLADQIRSLFDVEDRRFADIVEAVKDSAGSKAPLVKSLWIYGSVARGEDRLRSDLDVAVVAGAGDLAAVVETIRDSLAAHAERLGFTASVVGLDMSDVERLARDRDPWWANAVADAIVLSGRRPEELAASVGADADG